MAKNGPILVIDDDADDCELLNEAISQLKVKNPVRCFSGGKDALAYLRTTGEQPFVILCDINMPVMNGIELRQEIENDKQVKKKSIPFIFLTTASTPQTIKDAFKLSVQGFFIKGDTLGETKELLHEIFSYWQRCKHPNTDI